MIHKDKGGKGRDPAGIDHLLSDKNEVCFFIFSMALFLTTILHSKYYAHLQDDEKEKQVN